MTATVNEQTKKKTTRRRKPEIYRSADSNLKKSLADISEGMRLSPIWAPLTLQEMFTQFRRFFLGPFWIPLGMMVLVYILGYAYAYIFQRDYWDYTTYLFAGLVNWQIVQASLMGGFGLFTRQGRAMSHVRMPYTYYIYKHVFEALLSYLLVIPFLLAVLAIQQRLSINLLWAIPAFGLYALTSVFSVMLFAVISIRIRDLEAPISSVLRIVFLVTPIIWLVEEREGSRRAAFIDYNPFYHYLEVGRSPFMGDVPDPIHWYVSLSITAALGFLAFFAFVRARHRIMYWI